MLRIPRVEEQIMDLNAIERLFNERRFKKMMESNIAHILCRTDKRTSFVLTTKTSEIYTDGSKIVVGLPKEYEGKTYGQIYSMVKACVGHESAHVKWSNFNAIKDYLHEVNKKKISTSLGHSMFNIIEDGRIERLLCEELPGYTKHIQFLNLQLIKKDGNLRDTENVLGNIIGVIHFLAVLGIYPKNYKDLLGDKEREIIETKIHPLVLKGVMTNSYRVVQDVCLEILDLLKDYIPEPKSMPQELIDLLEFLAQETYQSSDGQNGKDADNLDDLVNMIMQNVQRQRSTNNASENSNLSQGDAEKGKQDSDEKSSSNDDSSSNEDGYNEGSSSDGNTKEQNSQENSGQKQEMSNNFNEDEDEFGNESSLENQEQSGNNDLSSDDNTLSDDKQCDKNNESSSEESKQKDIDSDENDELTKDSNEGKNSGEDNSAKNEAGEDDTNKNKSNDSSGSDESDNELDSEDGKKMSELLPAHFKDSDVDNSSFSYENQDEDFFENLVKEIEEEAQRAFEKIEKEEKRAKSDARNSFHAGIDIDEINSSYSSDKQEPGFEFIYPNCPCKKPQEEFRMKIHGLKKVFEKMLKNEESNYKGQKRGRLDTTRLWRTGINDTNIFKKRNTVEKSDYAVEMLIDVSGSMWDRKKYKNALGAAICIESALSGLQGVEVKTVAFNFLNGTRMLVLKDFKDKESKTPTVYESDITGGSNRDGFAIRVALDDLKKHNAKNKLLIVISDGMPNARPFETSNESIADVKDAVHKGRKDATIVSILINDGPIDSDTRNVFRYMYEDKGSILVDVYNEPENLMKNIILYLKKMFKN